VLTAVTRHDDAWGLRDAAPFLTREGRPSAFSRELVGMYSAFEEIDMADYLAVRGRAADVVAADNPYAAILISMHTVSLLTTHADLSGLSPADRELHARFIENQKKRQAELISEISGDPAFADAIQPLALDRGFRFLQACDSLSLGVCVRFPTPKALRHTHPRRDGTFTEIIVAPLGDDTYRLSPYPLDQDEVVLELPCRSVTGKMFSSLDSFRAAFRAAPVVKLKVKLIR
jgi:hypothetical protein